METGNEKLSSTNENAVDISNEAASNASAAASEAFNASSVAEQSGNAAASAASDATVAATAAMAAAANQGQLIEAVTAASREDAQRARDQAEAASNEAAKQAELASDVAELTVATVAAMIEEHNKRLTALESRPTVVQQNEGVSSISPQDVENNARNQSMSEEGESSASSRRSHGRRRR